MADDFVYLDYNATTPIDPRVAAAMQPFLSGGYGNPSSPHRLGRQAREAVDRARLQVATCLGSLPEEIVLTSGGSESNNLAIRGLVQGKGGGHVITSAIEHPAVLEVALDLEVKGQADLTIVGCDQAGRVDADEVIRAIRPNTILITLMLANNEVGTLQPVREISSRARQQGVIVHTDAAQAVGKAPVDVDELGVDLLTIAGHKLYAPKGVGALYVRRGVNLEPQIRGASHEMGLRAGTENVLSVVGLGTACELICESFGEEIRRISDLRDRLGRRLRDAVPDLVVHGDLDHRLPNTLSVAFPGVDAEAVLLEAGDRVAASTGAACHAETVRVSHVLAAMGVDRETARGTVRLSLGRFTTVADVERGADQLLAGVAL